MSRQKKLPELPRGWVCTRLGEIVQTVEQVSPKATPDEEFTYLDIASIVGQRILLPKKYLGKEAPSRARQLVKWGDVLFSTVRTYLKHIALVEERYDGEIASTGFCVIRPWPCIDSKLIFYFAQTDTFLNPLTQMQRGTSYPAVRDSDVFAQLLPLPPLPEQHRIVAKIEELFTRLDAGVEALKKVKAQLKAYRQAVLKHAFEGKLTAEWREAHKSETEPASALLERIREQRRRNAKGKVKELPPLDTSDLPELPEGWVWKRLGEVVSKISNGLTKRQERTASEGIPVTRIETISSGKIDLAKVGYVKDLLPEVIEKYRLSPGDILFSHINSDPHLGKTAIFHFDNMTLLHGMNLLLIQPDKDLIAPEFLHYLSNNYRSSGVFVSIAQHAVNQSSINQTKLNNLAIPLPPLPEQHEIVEEIDQRFSLADQIEKTVELSLKQADRLRQSILKSAFEGKLVPQDSTDEPAERLLERIKAEKASRELQAKPTRKDHRETTVMQRRLI